MKEKRILTEKEILEEGKKWSPRDFIDYYSQLYGAMTMDEFREFNMEIINKNFIK